METRNFNLFENEAHLFEDQDTFYFSAKELHLNFFFLIILYTMFWTNNYHQSQNQNIIYL